MAAFESQRSQGVDAARRTLASTSSAAIDERINENKLAIDKCQNQIINAANTVVKDTRPTLAECERFRKQFEEWKSNGCFTRYMDSETGQPVMAQAGEALGHSPLWMFGDVNRREQIPKNTPDNIHCIEINLSICEGQAKRREANHETWLEPGRERKRLAAENVRLEALKTDPVAEMTADETKLFAPM